MVALLNTIFKHLEKNGAYVDTLFADIVKAFDSLDHNSAVEEVNVIVARPFVLRMLASFFFLKDLSVSNSLILSRLNF